MKRKKICTGILSLLLAFAFAVLPAAGSFGSAVYAETETDSDSGDIVGGLMSGGKEYITHCEAGILYEATTDTVLYEKNADEQLVPASMTKVMTAILALEANPDMEGSVTVPENAVYPYYCSWMNGEHLFAGETVEWNTLLEYMLELSANEAASTIAFTLCDDIHDFVDMMNEKAEELGCENTKFADPHGLSSANKTTPRDMVKICQYAMTFEKFRDAVKGVGGEIPASEYRRTPLEYYNINAVMFPDDRYDSPYAQYMTGVKTGSTPAAGYCFSGCMEKDGLVYYSCVMRGDEEMYDDERTIQGDFRDTIELYELTEGLTYDSLMAEKGPSTAVIVGIVVAVIAVAGVAFVLIKKRKKAAPADKE